MTGSVAQGNISLEDRYTAYSGRIFVTGVQALVRLPMLQRERDARASLDTAGYITGYRGSPLGTYDQQLGQARKHLERHGILFQPGLNEDLAATAVAGTQQAGLDGEGRHDGVFAIWYAKGPGVDRSGDALRHGNLAGSARHGGVLCLLGDDHTCESSTTCHQSEPAMVDAMIPVLNPATVQEILEYGLLGIAMSRFSGAWVSLKCVHDTVESTAPIELRALPVRLPEAYAPPEGGLNIRWPDTPQMQEERLHTHKLEAAKAFARANGLDRVVWNMASPRMAVVTTGKSYMDVRQALEELGIDEAAAAQLGLRLVKIGMSWPLEPTLARDALTGLDLAIVVEEKRGLIEDQLRSLLYGRRNAPLIVGKRDEEGLSLFQAHMALSPNQIAAAIGRRLLAFSPDAGLAARLAEVEARARMAEREPAPIVRLPYFCAGCPHNSSTRVPEGSKARAGIGCHFMAQWMDRETARFTQMGGEGASWIGEGPFSRRPHMFQNLGDGTFFHSGLLAVRGAVSAGTNITYKVLFNDAVAMTGGQKMETGRLDPGRISRQLAAEGVGTIAVVTDEPGKYPAGFAFAPGVTVHHRDELDAVQRRLREIPGVTAIVYDQTCAAEKRRRRSRGEYPDPPRRVLINELVCEGCGDCGRTSNCVAVVPKETELGTKRAIDQSACNKDFSCLNGFCPSFVTVHGGRLRKGQAARGVTPPELPEPVLPVLERPYAVLIGGVGGTGVITIGALIGMAAHLEGRGFASLDMTGVAQKGGAVMTHLKVARSQEEIGSTRIAAGGADLVLGCDLVVAAGGHALETVRRGRTTLVVDTEEQVTGDFTRNPDLLFPGAALRRRITAAAGLDRTQLVDATRVAKALLGDSIAANLLLLGWAWQRGLVPVSREALLRAIEVNGKAVELNRQAFAWGRAHAHEPAAVEALIRPAMPVTPKPRSLDELVAHRTAFLAEYQDRVYAERYRVFVASVRAAETARAPGSEALAEAVARNLFRLMAYKDEYEVARLYSNGAFARQLGETFEGEIRLEFHLAPPLLARRDPTGGHPRKMRFGPWMMRLFGPLARFRRLRGTPFDPFGRTAERRMERALIVEYEATVRKLLEELTPERLDKALSIARIPEQIRGFGHVKERNLVVARARQRELLAAYREPQTAPALIAAE